MKNALFILAACVAVTTASLSFAGPGPQYWTEQARRAEERAKAQEEKSKAAPVTTTCTSCKCCSAKPEAKPTKT